MRAALIACVLPIFAATEVAAQDDACRNFSWSIGRPIDLFDEPLPTVQNAQSLPKEGVFAFLLKPAADVIYQVAPERGSDGGLGGIVTIESVPAGRYQIALSEEAWVDAVQDNARLPLLAPSQVVKECPGVLRSVEVELKGEPTTLQVGGAHVGRINIALVRIWPFEWRW
ncbi:MAG: hypothetical protein ACHQK9_15970 [Reyranellales bacterium]